MEWMKRGPLGHPAAHTPRERRKRRLSTRMAHGANGNGQGRPRTDN
jgi:hypothetical protein